VPSIDTAAPAYIGGSAFLLYSTVESILVSPDHLQVTAGHKLGAHRSLTAHRRHAAAPDHAPAHRREALRVVPGRIARREDALRGEPMAATIYEIDVASFQIRRTAPLDRRPASAGRSTRCLRCWHPVARRRWATTTGAVLSPDGSALYVLGAQGIWSIDLATLKASVLARDGAYEAVKVSPDGLRLYVLSREDGVVRAIGTHSGKIIGSMKRDAFPSDIVAVDAG